MKTHNFGTIVQKYKVVFFDSYGVLKDANGLLPGVVEAIDFLIDHQIDFFVLTNDASRSPEKLADKFAQLGLPAITSNKIISSGMLAREYLRHKVRSGRVAYLGTQASAHYIETAGLLTTSIRELNLARIDDISVLVLLDDEGFDWNHDISKAINLLRQRNIPVVVANTDLSYPISEHYVGVAIGGIATMMETIVGKHFMRFGKPSVQMFIFAYEHILKQYPTLSKRKILMVGDTLHTDIIGGNTFGIDTALVLSGNTLRQQAKFHIRSTGIIPDYICDAVAIQAE